MVDGEILQKCKFFFSWICWKLEQQCNKDVTTDALCTVLAPLNGLLMATVGGSDWTLCSAFVLSSRIIHTTLVYPLTLYSPFLGFYFFNGLMLVLQVLHIFWAVLILRMVIKFLPGNVWTATFNFLPIHHTKHSSQADNFSHFLNFCFFPSFAWQEIVEDERSDKEETESEDEGADRELREKSKNGHMQNGHAALNNNHSKRDWLDCERWRRGWQRALTCSLHLKAKEQERGILKVAAHTNTHTHLYIIPFSDDPVVWRG